MLIAPLFSLAVHISDAVIVGLPLIAALRALVFADDFLIGSVLNVAISVQCIGNSDERFHDGAEAATHALHRRRMFSQPEHHQQRGRSFKFSAGTAR